MNWRRPIERLGWSIATFGEWLSSAGERMAWRFAAPCKPSPFRTGLAEITKVMQDTMDPHLFSRRELK